MTSAVIYDIWKKVMELSDTEEVESERLLRMTMYALGGLFWAFANDKQQRGDLSQEEKSNLVQTANAMRKFSYPDSEYLPL